MIEGVERFDAIVIGSGQGGKPLARAFAAAGRKTAIIERARRVGGTCIIDGCTPSKTMVASARIAHLVRRAAQYGVRAPNVRIDMHRVRRRKRAMVERFSQHAAQRIAAQDGLELVSGEARFTGPRVLEVAVKRGPPRRMSAATIVIDTGLRAAIPAIDGLDQVGALDNRSIMELDAPPAHLLVVDGGPAGLEFAQVFRRLGSRVTLINRAQRLLETEDDDVSDALAEILAGEGVRILNGATARSVRRRGSTRLSLRIESSNGRRSIDGSHLLLAAGRVPNTGALNLGAAGVACDAAGYVRTNDRLETSATGVYAIGDVKGGPAYTHISYDDYRILEQNLLHGCDRRTAERLVPYAVYTDPELGRVGLSEREAQARGIGYRLAKLPMTHVARALETDETRGFMKALVDPRSLEILGCAILAPHGAEVMSVVEMAMLGTLPYSAVRDAVFAHPAFAEALNSLFAALEG